MFRDNGWKIQQLFYPTLDSPEHWGSAKRATTPTPFGPVAFGDGILSAINENENACWPGAKAAGGLSRRLHAK